MGYTIEKRDGYIEVRLSGKGSKLLIFKVIAELMRMDPAKKYPDLWIIDPEFQIPYVEYSGIAKALAHVIAKISPGSKKSALIADNEFQKAQMELYEEELSLWAPIDIRIFKAAEDAVAWFKSAETKPT